VTSSRMPVARDLRGFCCLGVVLAIGYLDFSTGPNISLTLLYLIPVVAAGWTIGQRGAVIVALIAGLTSLLDATFSSDIPTAAVIWNAVSRAAVLAIAAIAVDRIRRDRDRLLMQDEQRARSLELLDRGLSDPARHLVDVAEHWDGSADELKKLVKRRADEIAFLARDFSSMIRLQNGELALRRNPFDFIELIDEIRTEQERSDRRILLTGPTGPMAVMGDRARIRQSLDALISERAAGSELSFLLDRKGSNAELVIASGEYRPAKETAETAG